MDDPPANGSHDDAAAVLRTLTEVLALLGPDRARRVRVRSGRFGLDVTLRPRAADGRAAAGSALPAEDHATGPAAAEPRAAQQEAARPGTAQQEAAQPRAARPGAAEPETARSEAARPEAAERPTTPITAPAIGVFHRRPAPGEPPFVHVGDRVATGAEVGLVEAMKTFTPVVADRAGVIRAVHVEDARVVEYGQALFDLEPEPTAGRGAS